MTSQINSLGQSTKRKRTVKVPVIFSKFSPAKPTVVFNTYWRFACERQSIFFKKKLGEKEPWTRDAILKLYKFTNAYRASDRVSQYLIKDVIYKGEQNVEEVFFRILLFKIFNKIDTWEVLEKRMGGVSYAEYSFDLYNKILEAEMAKGNRIYSAAYIMASGGSAFGHPRKHSNHLKLIELLMNDEVPFRIAESKSMKHVFDLLRSYPTIGDFLAYQYAIDINYSQMTNFSENEFVMPGPGALDGIAKCFESLGGLAEGDIVRMVTDRQEIEFDRLGLEFKSLWGRPLQLIDCQNLFCEVDKYSRIAHPDIKGKSGRTRIKQIYKPRPNLVNYWYPPKWGINHLIESSMSQL